MQCTEPQGQAKDDPNNASTLINDDRGKRGEIKEGEKEEVITTRFQSEGYLLSLGMVGEGKSGRTRKRKRRMGW